MLNYKFNLNTTNLNKLLIRLQPIRTLVYVPKTASASALSAVSQISKLAIKSSNFCFIILFFKPPLLTHDLL